MHSLVVFLLCSMQIASIYSDGFQDQSQFQNNGGFNNGFNNNGFNAFQPIPVISQRALFSNQALQQMGNSGGNAAAAGSAGAGGLGSATSINQANHQANLFNTQASGLSANTANGFGPQAGGAAQANGQVQNALLSQASFGSQSGFTDGRRKRQIDNDMMDNFNGGGNFGMNNFGMNNLGSQANANSIGGGSAMLGSVMTNNNAFSQTNPFGGMGFAAGNSMGEGQGVNIFQAASSNSGSGMFGRRRKRQIGTGFNGYNNNGYNNNGYNNGGMMGENGWNSFGMPQSQGNANSIGGGSALLGRVATNNNAFSQTNPYGGMGFAAGNSLGEGQGVNIFNAANTNSGSGVFGG